MDAAGALSPALTDTRCRGARYPAPKPERENGSIYPGPTDSTVARREMNMTRGLMGTRMIGVDMARRYCCVGTDTAKHEGHDENPACRPDHGIGSRRFR